MRVKFKMNLGTRDADKLGLNYQECQCGMECEVCDEVGEKLVASNIAVPVAGRPIKAVPAKAAIADAVPVAISGVKASQPEEPKPEPKPTEAKEPPKQTTKPNAKK